MVWLTVDIHWPAKIIDRQAVFGVDFDLLLIRVADRKIRDVLLAVGIRSRHLRNTATNSRFKQNIASLFELKFAGHRTFDCDRVLCNHRVVLPFLLVAEHRPSTDGRKALTDHRLTFAVSNYVLVTRNKVKADEIFLAPINSESSKDVSRVFSFLTNENLPLNSAGVRIPLLDHVRGVDGDLGIEIGRVDPDTRKVVRKRAFRRDHFGFDRYQLQAFRSFLWRSQNVALGRGRHGHVNIVISIRQKTAILLLHPTFARVHDRKKVILADVPIAQTFVLNFGILRFGHSFTLSIIHRELLIEIRELSPRYLARGDVRDVRLWMDALAGELHTVSIGKPPDTFQTGSTVLAGRIGGEQGGGLFLRIQMPAHIGDARRFVLQIQTGSFGFLKHI